jgi:DNA replication protein DnaC
MKAARGLDKALFQKLAAGDWIDRHQNLIVIVPTGVGKSWIACALAHKACRDDRSVFSQRVPRLFDALALDTATAVMAGSSEPWRASSCWSSRTGGSLR